MTEGGNPPVAKQDHADIQDVSRAVGRRGRWKWPRQATGYLMIAPAIIFLMLVIVYPLFEVFRLSFFEFTGLRDQQSTFVGLKNFVSLMGDRIYWISMKNTLVFVLATVVFHALIGLLFALALHQHWPQQPVAQSCARAADPALAVLNGRGRAGMGLAPQPAGAYQLPAGDSGYS